MKDLEEEIVKKWQRKWTQSTKGRTTKEYFPEVAERLKMKLQLTQNFTAIVSGHGKTRDYLHNRRTSVSTRKRGPDNRPLKIYMRKVDKGERQIEEDGNTNKQVAN